MPNCSVFCCNKRSGTSNLQKDGVTFHIFPRNPGLKKVWKDFCNNKRTWEPKRTSVICSVHFQPSDYHGKNRRRLVEYAMPRLIPNCICASHQLPNEPWYAAGANMSTPYLLSSLGESSQQKSQQQREPEENESLSPKDQTQDFKQEIEDSFSEHEEDIAEALENRKRQHEADPLAGLSQKIKVEYPEEEITIEIEPEIGFAESMPRNEEDMTEDFIPQEKKKRRTLKPKVKAVDISPQSNLITVEVNKDKNIFPLDFMKSVLNSQEEILSVLKSQVLLENPDPDLLMFLRLVGAKLSRVDPTKRNQIQNEMLNVIDLNL